MTFGEYRIKYPGEVGTSTSDLLTIKLLCSIEISTKDKEFITLDISDFYLNSPIGRYKYIRINITDLPGNIINEYKFKEKVTKEGYFYVEICK